MRVVIQFTVYNTCMNVNCSHKSCHVLSGQFIFHIKFKLKAKSVDELAVRPFVRLHRPVITKYGLPRALLASSGADGRAPPPRQWHVSNER